MLMMDFIKEYSNPSIRPNMRLPRLEFSKDHTDYKIESEQTMAKVEMTRTNGQIEFDMRDLWEQLGKRSVARIAEDAGAEGMRHIQEYTEQVVDEGNTVAQVEKGNSWAEIATSKLVETKEELETIFLPSGMPIKTSYTPGELKTNVTPSSLSYRVTPPTTSFNFVPGEHNYKPVLAQFVPIEQINMNKFHALPN